MKKTPDYHLLLGLLQAFNGLSGLLGGFGLISDPSGRSLGLQLTWLDTSPFQDFLIPGIVLFTLVGALNTAGAWITFSKTKKRALFAAALGVILMGWIVFQVAWIGYKSFLQPFYFATGLFQAVLGMIIHRRAAGNAAG